MGDGTIYNAQGSFSRVGQQEQISTGTPERPASFQEEAAEGIWNWVAQQLNRIRGIRHTESGGWINDASGSSGGL